MIFNYPDVKSFRDALSKAGFYKEWRAKFGDEARPSTDWKTAIEATFSTRPRPRATIAGTNAASSAVSPETLKSSSC